MEGVLMKKKSALVVLALLAVALLLAGCGGDDDGGTKNYFKGTWEIVGLGLEVTFGDQSYSLFIPGAGSFTGTYSFEGDYPDFVGTIQSGGGTILVTVHFNNENQFVASGGGYNDTFNRI